MRIGNEWSARKRLTLLAAGVMSLFCLGVSASMLSGLQDLAVHYRIDHMLRHAAHLVQLIDDGRLPARLESGHADLHLQVADPRGRIVSATTDLVGRPSMIDPRTAPASVTEGRTVCDSPAFPARCVTVTSFRVPRPGGAWVALSATDTVPWYVTPGVLAQFVVGSALLVGLTSAGTYRIVAKTLAPVEAISAELTDIKANDIGRRVPVPSTHDEVRRLADTVNRTLDRLESLVNLQRRFASDASHDLRSPLTAMRAEIEAALLHPRDADWAQVADAQLDSLERLEALVDDLLMLTKLDAGMPVRREVLELSRLVAHELDHRSRQVPVLRHLKPGVMVNGDPLRLARLLTNLVDNAERHAKEKITVTVDESGGWAVLEVLDDGAGIPPDQREIVFERFTRLDAARSKDAGGTGLGLPIAREVAREHGGTLTVEDSASGARFVARLPVVGGPFPDR